MSEIEPHRTHPVPAAAIAQLTKSEREVLTALARLARLGDVAAEIGRSPHTINNQLKSARRKLGVTDSLTAARIFVAAGHSQYLASSSLAIDPPTAAGSTERQELAEAPAPVDLVMQEERVVFDHNPLIQPALPPNEGKRVADDLIQPRAVLAPKLQTIFSLAVLILALLALAPHAGQALQGLANFIQPPH